MNLTDELRKLSELNAAGQLSDEEFAAAKRRLLADSASGGGPTVNGATVSTVPDKPSRFRSSRWSSGNLFFPDTLTLAHDGMHFRKGALFSSSEEHIAYHAIASMRVKNGLFLSNLSVETSGGSQPIFINGLWKSDSRKIQELVRIYQDQG